MEHVLSYIRTHNGNAHNDTVPANSLASRCSATGRGLYPGSTGCIPMEVECENARVPCILCTIKNLRLPELVRSPNYVWLIIR